jgi:virginiamycin B lyase
MSSSLRSRLAGLLLFAVIVGVNLVGNSVSAQNRYPRFQSATVSTPIYEGGVATLVFGVSDPDRRDKLKVTINWGDGTAPGVVRSTNGFLRYFTNYHGYLDRAGSNRLADRYKITLTLTDGKGGVATRAVYVSVTNTIRLTVNANSPVIENAPATERALEYREFALPTRGSSPFGITVGPDDNIWFTEIGANKIGRLTRNGALTEWPVVGALGLRGICAGPDGRLWFACGSSDRIGRITTNGVIRLFDIPHPPWPFRVPWAITPAPDGTSLWFVGLGYRVSRITTGGAITTEYLHENGRNFYGVTFGADNNLWYTDGGWGQCAIHRRNSVSGEHIMYPIDPYAVPIGIARGPDDAVWFTEYTLGKIGRFNVDGQLTEAEVGDNLPWGITAGPGDGAMWFTEQRPTNSNIVRLKLNGDIQRFALPWLSYPQEIVAAHGDSLWLTIPARNRVGRLRYTDVGNVVLYVNIQDTPTDRHTVVFDWADGSAPVSVLLAPGQRTYSAAHTYTVPGTYNVFVSVRDDDGTTSEAWTTVEVLPAGTLQESSSVERRFEEDTSFEPPGPPPSVPFDEP